MNLEIKKIALSLYLTMFIIVLALLGIFWYFTRSFVTIKVFPHIANVRIDGTIYKVSSSGTIKTILEPGQHEVQAEADDFIGQSQKLNFGRGTAKAVTINLPAMPKPVEITTDANMLAKGSDFNDGYYLGNGGKTLYKIKIGVDGTSGSVKVIDNKAITDAKLTGVNEIIWSPTKELALFRKSNGDINLFDFMKYDFVHQTEIFWGKNIGSIAWAPDNSEIAYIYTPPSGEKSLIFSNLTNSSITRVANISDYNIQNPILHWSPDSEWLLVIPRNSSYGQNKIYAFNAYSRSFTTLTEDGDQLDAIFSPDSNKILYTTYQKDPANPSGGIVSIMNKDGSDKRSLAIRADLNKVAWSKDSTHIVVATYDPELKHDVIYRFNTETATQDGFILRNLGDISVDGLNLSDDDKMILYETGAVLFGVKVGE